MSVHLGLLLSLMELVSCLDQVVKTKNGLLRGTTVEFEKAKVQAFLGVPFAEPPLGELRFRKPRPAKEWSGVRDATKMPPACIQFSFYPFPTYDFKNDKSEDCLYLNIWLPENTRASDRKAVMFWIYGGGFTLGSITKPAYDGTLLTLIGDVIVVTFNYRVGSLGFLNSNSDEAPGNMGMYDQLLAMRWVNENIEYFGGDPKRVTLFGEGSGSVSVSFWCNSPLAKGLFQRVIMESGSAALLKNNNKHTSLSFSQKLAKAVFCATDDRMIYQFPEEVVGCLRKVDAMHLAVTQASFNPSTLASFSGYSTDYYFPIMGNELFPKEIRKSLIRGRFNNVDVLIGNNKDEGSFELTAAHPEVFGFFGQKDTLFNKSYALTLLKERFLGNPSGQEVYNHYIANIEDNNYEQIRQQVFTAMGDYTLTCPDVYFAETYAKANQKVYYYYFEHRSSTSPWAKWMGVVHSTEVQFVFGLPFLYPKYYSDSERGLSYRMMAVWTEFANNGSLPWKEYSLDDHMYRRLVARPEEINSLYGVGPNLKNCDFFRKSHLSYN